MTLDCESNLTISCKSARARNFPDSVIKVTTITFVSYFLVYTGVILAVHGVYYILLLIILSRQQLEFYNIFLKCELTSEASKVTNSNIPRDWLSVFELGRSSTDFALLPIHLNIMKGYA